jgi:hypothetical protein
MADQKIGLEFTAQELEKISSSIADVLCWVRGFEAAHFGREGDVPGPYGIRELRDLNIKIKNTLHRSPT